MADQRAEPVPKTTPNIIQEQIERLRRLFPECVTEGKVDFERLRATLGEADALAGDNGYSFTWAGKQEAFRAIQTPSGASLAPAPEESTNWDETRHLFIEGENLEVLKLLYKSYFGQVKMTYIDPPYNTRNDFIYRDDYSEPRRAYLEKTGQMDADRLVRRMLQVATDSDSHDIVMDFFAGTASTAHAVLEYNREDKGNRRLIVVQMPEEMTTAEGGMETIADIGKERIRRVVGQIQEGPENNQLSFDLRPDEDLGFKVFKLAPSTFRHWEPPEGEGAGALEEQLALFDRGVEEGSDPHDVIYEVILKLGYSLNARIEPLEVESNRVYRVTDEEGSDTSEPAQFYICLDDQLRDKTIDALSLDRETAFVCLDTALDDSQKVNLAMTCLLKVI